MPECRLQKLKMRLIINFSEAYIQAVFASTRIYYTTSHKPMSNFFIGFTHILIITCYNMRCIMQNFSFIIKKNRKFCFFRVSGSTALNICDLFYYFPSSFKQIMQVQIAEQ